MILILMATYNGEQYLREQLDSLMDQTVRDLHIVIRDDCSTDSTWGILQAYQKESHGKITLLRNKRNSGSAKYNFLQLMADFQENYLMLCDQDDIWLPDKVEKTLAEMKRLEMRYGADRPVLVHTDLRVVDNALETISPSFRVAMHADYTKTTLNQQLIQNTLTGCTCMYNRALAEYLRHVPEGYVVMHDWYLMLVAAAFGFIGHVDEPTILYRQHGANVIGAKNVRTLRYKINRFMHLSEVREAVDLSYRQAETFLQEFCCCLTPEQTALVRAYCEIPSLPKLARWQAAQALGTMKNGISRQIAHFIVI